MTDNRQLTTDTMPRKSLFSAVLVAAVLSCACASVTAEHAKRVGSAGQAWGRAIEAVMRAAEESAVDADSARVLSEARGLSLDGRRAVLEKHAGISAEVADFERLRVHARLLARYFEKLRDLADPAADQAADAAVSKAAGAATDLGRELSGSTLLTSSERDLLGQVAGLAVRGVREHALSRELELRGAAVAHELLVQQTLLEAVRRNMRADAASIRDLGVQRDVSRPFLDGTVTDPAGWIALRRTYILPATLPEALAQAGDTASRLRKAWAALAGGLLDAAAWSALQADAEDLASLARSISEVRR